MKLRRFCFDRLEEKEMNYRIKTMSLYGDDILNKNACGIVHSVYRKTVNLALGGSLLALQPDGSPMSPVSLLIRMPENEFECLEIEAGDYVFVTEEAVEIKTGKGSEGLIRFLRCGADRKDLRLTEVLNPSRIQEVSEALEEKLSESPLGSHDVSHPILNAATKWIEEVEAQLNEENWDGAADSLCRLIGLGIGLTPGGDDFLCGVLAGMMLGGVWSHPFAHKLRDKIAAGIDRTNDISRTFLTCALEGQLGPAVHAFYNETPEAVLCGMRQIGHTSGIDTLQGILYAFRFLDKLKSECAENRMKGAYHRKQEVKTVDIWQNEYSS